MRYLVKVEILIQATGGSDALQTVEKRLSAELTDSKTGAPLKQAEIVRATVSVEERR